MQNRVYSYEARAEILDVVIARYTRRGFQVSAREPARAILVKPKSFSIWKALVGLLLLGIGLVVYIIFYLFLTTDQRIILEVDDYGQVRRGTGSSQSSFQWVAFLGGFVVVCAALVIVGMVYFFFHSASQSTGVRFCTAANLTAEHVCTVDSTTFSLEDMQTAVLSVGGLNGNPFNSSTLTVTLSTKDATGAYAPSGTTSFMVDPFGHWAVVGAANIFAMAGVTPAAGSTYQVVAYEAKNGSPQSLGSADFTITQ